MPTLNFEKRATYGMEYDVNSVVLSNPLPVETVLTSPTFKAYQLVLLSVMGVVNGEPEISIVMFMLT